MPKVSVIVPVYNTVKFLDKCLDSLVNQTLDDIEIVLINDGSTDGSEKLIKEYCDKYPSKIVCRDKENGGQASARNLGLSICTGEYIGFLDSDDYVKYEMFEKLYNKAIAEEADYVGCAYTDLQEYDGKRIVLKEYVGNKPCSTNRRMFLGGALVSPFINFYKAGLIKDHEIKFTEGYIYEDTAFWAKIVPYVQKPVYLEEALAYRVRHDNSTTTITKPEKVKNIFPVIEDIIDYYKSNELINDFGDEIEYFCSRILVCSSLDRISRVESKEARNDLIRDTFGFLKEHFPEYKRNKLLSNGKVDLYIKASCVILAKVIVLIKRLKG